MYAAEWHYDCGVALSGSPVATHLTKNGLRKAHSTNKTRSISNLLVQIERNLSQEQWKLSFCRKSNGNCQGEEDFSRCTHNNDVKNRLNIRADLASFAKNRRSVILICMNKVWIGK